MLDKELQANLIPPVLSYKPDNSNQSAQPNESEDFDESKNTSTLSTDQTESIKSIESTESIKSTEPIIPIAPATPTTPMPPTTPMSPTTPVNSTTPANSAVSTEKSSTIKTTTNLTSPQSPTTNQTPKTEPIKSPVQESTPDVNLTREILPQELSLQNILLNKDSINISNQNGNNAKYTIYLSTSPAPAAIDTPKSTYANQYSTNRQSQNDVVSINHKTESSRKTIIDTKNIKQSSTETKHIRLINTIDTTLERPIIYD
ncbi:MAG: hypothetical protein LBB88_12355 [Planctomycetaceae bacterium]|nr:hypothetical protein [Planctomycetaceae bacterium]